LVFKDSIFFLKIIKKSKFLSVDYNLSLIIAISGSLIALFRGFLIVDEGHVNLSHAYNLYHNGLFSFSPDKLVTGTNEVLAMLLISPFAQNHISLFIGYFILVSIFTVVSVVYVFKIIKHIFPYDYNKYSILIPIAIFPLFFIKSDFYSALSGGFANIMSACFLLITIYYLLENKYRKMSIFAFLSAFSRLDSILWLFAIFASDAIVKRKVNWKLLASSILGLFVLMLFFKLYYGLWIPTPVIMKINNPFDWDVMIYKLFYVCSILFSIFIPTFLILLIKIKQLNTEKIFFVLLYLFTFLGSCIIILKDSGYQYSIFRYVLPFIFIMLICFVFAFHFLLLNFKSYKKYILYLFLMFIIVMSSVFILQIYKDIFFKWSKSYYYRYDIGAFLPKDLSLMSREVSLMFYSRDNKNVIDIYGYTNPDLIKMKDKKCYSKNRKYYSTLSMTIFTKSYTDKLVSKYKPDMIFMYEQLDSTPHFPLFSYENIANLIGVNYLDKDEIRYIKNNYKFIFIDYPDKIIDYRYGDGGRINYFLLVKNANFNKFDKHMISAGAIKKDFIKKYSLRKDYHTQLINTCDD